MMRAPLEVMHVTSPFGPRGAVTLPDGTTRPAAFHNGVDLRAAVGTVVMSPVTGRVTKVNMTERGGLQMFVEGEGFRFALVHLHDILEPPDAPVEAGEPIALSGDSGGVAPHLHIEARELATGELVDPMTLFGRGGGGGGGGGLLLAGLLVTAAVLR